MRGLGKFRFTLSAGRLDEILRLSRLDDAMRISPLVDACGDNGSLRLSWDMNGFLRLHQ